MVNEDAGSFSEINIKDEFVNMEMEKILVIFTGDIHRGEILPSFTSSVNDFLKMKIVYKRNTF